MRVGEEHFRAGIERELGVRGQLLPAVPRESLAELFGQFRHRHCQCRVHRDRTVPTERGAVLHGWLLAPALEPGQMHQKRGAAAALDERADRGSSGPDDQITLPYVVLVGDFGAVVVFDHPRVAGMAQVSLPLGRLTGNGRPLPADDSTAD